MTAEFKWQAIDLCMDVGICHSGADLSCPFVGFSASNVHDGDCSMRIASSLYLVFGLRRNRHNISKFEFSNILFFPVDVNQSFN